jgi:tetratricopeptide (TPR) repeat protein
VDHTIVNPRHLEPSLRDAVCEQCHLEGEARTLRRGRGLYDFRPGLPLELFWSVFVRASDAGEKRKAVGHVEQMYQSRCFQSGDGPNRLGCISCHDPHRRVPPAERVAHYRGRCLQCHEPQRCSLPQAERLRRTAADSCIDCHMPRYAATDIPHTAATDHRIPRDAKPAAPHGNEPPAAGAGLPLAPFYGDRKEADDREVARDLALALVTRARTGETSASRVLGRTLPLLDMALQRDPGDLPAGEARGYALGLLGRWPEALAAFEAVLAQAPERELALVGAASATEALGQKETSLGYWRRAVAANPWAPDYRRRLALLLVKEEAWDEARRECEAWVRLDPFSAEARSTRVLCLLAAGNKEEARAEFARITALAPPNLRELQERFARKLR